jgi:hypothetical protein
MTRNQKNQKNKDQLKMFIIEVTFEDGEKSKYVIHRKNFYEAKEEAEYLKQSYNEVYDIKISETYIKEAQY